MDVIPLGPQAGAQEPNSLIGCTSCAQAAERMAVLQPAARHLPRSGSVKTHVAAHACGNSALLTHEGVSVRAQRCRFWACSYNGSMKTLENSGAHRHAGAPVDIAVIGGGAAGLASAVMAAERLAAGGLPGHVTVYERDDRVGRSVLATGNGRCNFSNAQLDGRAYHNAAFAERVLQAAVDAWLRAAPKRDRRLLAEEGDPVHAFFAGRGLVWREEADGRQYPLTNKASSVLDVLREAAASAQVEESCHSAVLDLEPPRAFGRRFTLRMEDGVFARADAVIIACGGTGVARMGESLERALPSALAFVPPRPTLAPLATEADDARELDNIRVRCEVSLMRSDAAFGPRGKKAGRGPCAGVACERLVASERGELLFRKYGVSGIAVFNLSRHALPGDVLSINFLPVEARHARAWCAHRRARAAERAGGDPDCEAFLRGLVLPRIAHVVLKRRGLTARSACSEHVAAQIADELSEFRLVVRGIGDEGLSQVRRGGFDVRGIDAGTLCVRAMPGLFIAGEALDVDGPCGGYNLHWAWASGIVAGVSAAAFTQGEGRAR